MSDDDDRMERAERIREMRESREPAATDDEVDDRDSNEVEEEGNDANGVEADGQSNATEKPEATVAETDGNEPREVVEGESEGEQEATNEGDVHGNEATGTAPAPTASRSAPANADADTRLSGPSASGGLAPLGSAAGFSLSDATDDGEAAQDDDEDARESDERTAGSRTQTRATAAAAESSIRVLEFTVGEQTYCFDIERVEEIVKRETVTRVPNTPSYVEGVVDLRGQITTILDTKRLLDVEEAGREGLLVIFAPDAFEEHGSVGWVVDEVRQVVPVTDEGVRTPPSDDDHVRGIVDRDGAEELVVWIRPGVAMTRAVEGEVGDAATADE